MSIPERGIQWDKTQHTWHVDIDKVGRYSVRRPEPRQPYAAYLNGELIESVRANGSVDKVKADVEERIRVADAINNAKAEIVDHRAELIMAAKIGIAQYLSTTRGANLFGAKAKVIETNKGTGLCVQFKDDSRIYFDTTEM